MIDVAIEFLWDILKSFLWWILLFPVILVLASPIILLISLVGHPATYFTRVGGNFRRTFEKKYDVAVLTEQPEEEFVSIESTEYWKEMEKNRFGNLLAGARLKAGLTQAQLAGKLGIRQNMISDYDRAVHGQRRNHPYLWCRILEER